MARRYSGTLALNLTRNARDDGYDVTIAVSKRGARARSLCRQHVGDPQVLTIAVDSSEAYDAAARAALALAADSEPDIDRLADIDRFARYVVRRAYRWVRRAYR